MKYRIQIARETGLYTWTEVVESEVTIPVGADEDEATFASSMVAAMIAGMWSDGMSKVISELGRDIRRRRQAHPAADAAWTPDMDVPATDEVAIEDKEFEPTVLAEVEK